MFDLIFENIKNDLELKFEFEKEYSISIITELELLKQEVDNWNSIRECIDIQIIYIMEGDTIKNLNDLDYVESNQISFENLKDDFSINMTPEMGGILVVRGSILKEKIFNNYGVDTKNNYLFNDVKSFLEHLDWIKNSISLKEKIGIFIINNSFADKQIESPFFLINDLVDGEVHRSLLPDARSELEFLNTNEFKLTDSPRTLEFNNHFYTNLDKQVFELYLRTIVRKLLNILGDLEEDDNFKITGLKTVFIKMDKNILGSDIYENLYLECDQIFRDIRHMWKFLLDERRFVDKKMFLNQSLTLYLATEGDYVDFIHNLSNIINQAETSFEKYVKKSVEVFIQQETKLIEIYSDASNTIKESINDLTKKVRDSFLAFISVLFLTFLDKNDHVMHSTFINVALLSYTIYGIISLLSIFSAKRQNDLSVENYVSMVEKISKQISKPAADEYKDDYVNKSKKQLSIVFWGSVVFIFLTTISFLALFLVHRHPE